MFPRFESVLVRVARVRRFGRLAARDLRRELRAAGRSAVSRSLADVRRAWLWSDPEWSAGRFERLAPSPEDLALLESARRERENTRARLAVDGPAVYEGEVKARVAYRGIRLADDAQHPDLDDWLCEVLGLDGWAGDSVRARISVEVIDNPPTDTPTDARHAPADGEQAAGEQPGAQEENTLKEEPDEHDAA